MGADLSIGEVARRTGEATSTLRYWESVGLLPPPPRVSGQRRYSRSVLETVGLIQLGQRAGMSLASIRTLLTDERAGDAPRVRWALVAEERAREIDDAIAALTAERRVVNALLTCTCDSFAGCVQQQATA